MSNRKTSRAAALFELALQHFQRGQVDQARKTCLQVLERKPGFHDALYLLGIVSLQAGAADEAIGWFQKTIAIAPANADAIANLAQSYVVTGRLPEALATFERARRFAPDDPSLGLGAGNCLAMMGRLAEAETVLREIVERHPRYVLGWLNLAHTVANQGRYEEARTLHVKVTELVPQDAGAWCALGNVLGRLERYAAALECYQRSETLGPATVDSLLGRGMVLRKLGRVVDALVPLKQALQLKPDMADIHFHLGAAYEGGGHDNAALECYQRAMALLRGAKGGNSPAGAEFAGVSDHYSERRIQLLLRLGYVLDRLGKLTDSHACFREAFSLDPNDPDVLQNLANICHRLGQEPEAVVYIEKALALNKNFAEALETMGGVCGNQDHWDDSLAWFEKALQIKPELWASRFNVAMLLLMKGDLKRGWEEWDWRFRQESLGSFAVRQYYSQREWRGEPLVGKRILVWGEQGVGDEILHASMISEVAAQSAYCVLECAPKLVSLFARSFPGVQVAPRSDPPDELARGDFDFQAPVGDLGKWLRPSLNHFPRRSGYLAAPPERAAYWKKRLATLGDGLKVGFSWRSSDLSGRRALSCTSLGQWEEVFSVPGVHFVSLQYDECAMELDQAQGKFGVQLHAFPEVDLFNDLDEAAALTTAVDLVITAPTSVALLSGGLGVPTWQMSFGMDWTLHGTDSYPWFPSIRVFRRAHDQMWEEILRLIADALRLHATSLRGSA